MKYYTKTEIDVMINNGRKILLVDNNIFDVTNFEHPFNINPFDKKIGQNVKIDYNFHDKNSKKIWKEYKIGEIESSWCTIC